MSDRMDAVESDGQFNRAGLLLSSELRKLPGVDVLNFDEGCDDDDFAQFNLTIADMESLANLAFRLEAAWQVLLEKREHEIQPCDSCLYYYDILVDKHCEGLHECFFLIVNLIYEVSPAKARYKVLEIVADEMERLREMINIDLPAPLMRVTKSNSEALRKASVAQVKAAPREAVHRAIEQCSGCYYLLRDRQCLLWCTWVNSNPEIFLSCKLHPRSKNKNTNPNGSSRQ